MSTLNLVSQPDFIEDITSLYEKDEPITNVVRNKDEFRTIYNGVMKFFNDIKNGKDCFGKDLYDTQTKKDSKYTINKKNILCEINKRINRDNAPYIKLTFILELTKAIDAEFTKTSSILHEDLKIVDTNFKNLNKHIDVLNERASLSEKHNEEVDVHVQKVDDRVEEVDNRISAIDEQISQINAKCTDDFATVCDTTALLTNRADKTDTRVNNAEDRIIELNAAITEMRAEIRETARRTARRNTYVFAIIAIGILLYNSKSNICYGILYIIDIIQRGVYAIMLDDINYNALQIA